MKAGGVEAHPRKTTCSRCSTCSIQRGEHLEQVEHLNPHPLISRGCARRNTRGVHTKRFPNFSPIPLKATGGWAIVSSLSYGSCVAITASTRSIRLFNAPKGIDLIAESFEKNLKPLHRELEKQSKAIASFLKSLDTPNNRMELHIYRRASKGQTPSLALLIKQLLSRFAHLFITLLNLQNLFAYRIVKKKLSRFLHLIGLTPCAPNLPLR